MTLLSDLSHRALSVAFCVVAELVLRGVHFVLVRWSRP